MWSSVALLLIFVLPPGPTAVSASCTPGDVFLAGEPICVALDPSVPTELAVGEATIESFPTPTSRLGGAYLRSAGCDDRPTLCFAHWVQPGAYQVHVRKDLAGPVSVAA